MSIDNIYLTYNIIEVIGMRSRIRDLREDNDLTQQQVADAIGITQRKYSYIETETQPLTAELLIKLADFYNTNIDYLLYRTNKSGKI